MSGVKGRSGGRNAKTTEQHEVEGTYKSSRHDGVENPSTVPGRPKLPGKLGKVARKHWRRTIELLEETRTCSREIATALYQYCQLFAETEELAAHRLVRRKTTETLEMAIQGFSGEPLVQAIGELTKLYQLDAKDATQIRQYRLALRTYLVEFGLTPAARGRVKMVATRPPKDHEQTPLQKLQTAQRSLRAV